MISWVLVGPSCSARGVEPRTSANSELISISAPPLALMTAHAEFAVARVLGERSLADQSKQWRERTFERCGAKLAAWRARKLDPERASCPRGRIGPTQVVAPALLVTGVDLVRHRAYRLASADLNDRSPMVALPPPKGRSASSASAPNAMDRRCRDRVRS